jgi:hypothetical protein
MLTERDVRSAARLLFWFAPMASVVTFVVLYALAALLYPGGTHSDPTRKGFSFVDNYWCDLLGATTCGGRPNPARPVAVVAMAILCTGLGVLWWATPLLFAPGSRRAHVVRASGIGSALVVPWIASTFHDLAIDIAGLLGALAFVATMTGRRRRRAASSGSTTIGWCTLALIAVNYLVWQTRFGLRFLPLIQKMAFTAFLTWVVLLSTDVRKAGARNAQRPAA